MVRGLDYYSDVVFECVDNSGRSQDSFCGGGRYDDLATHLGSKNPVPAAGFAIGVERLIDSMVESGLTVKNKDTIDLYFIQVGEEAKKLALPPRPARDLHTQDHGPSPEEGYTRPEIAARGNVR